MAKKSDLHTLIRMRKWDVDEKQRALGALLRDEDKLLQFLADLETELAREKKLAAQAEATQLFTLEPYIQRYKERRTNIENALVLLRQRIFQAREDLAEAYRRLKTFEITQEQRETAEAAEENRLEQIGLDEMGIELHRRKAVMPVG